jgi:hypothetical protein
LLPLLIALVPGCASAPVSTDAGTVHAEPPPAAAVEPPRIYPRIEELLEALDEDLSFVLIEPGFDMSGPEVAAAPPEADAAAPNEAANAIEPSPPEPAARPPLQPTKPPVSPPSVPGPPGAVSQPKAASPSKVPGPAAAVKPPEVSASDRAAADALLREAREAAAAKRYTQAIGLLNEFRASNPDLNDEAWWLYGQCFEASSLARDIKGALDAYTAIVRGFPASNRYKAALNRIAYLNKFYFNIN